MCQTVDASPVDRAGASGGSFEGQDDLLFVRLIAYLALRNVGL
jgi:hypothetical protein